MCSLKHRSQPAEVRVDVHPTDVDVEAVAGVTIVFESVSRLSPPLGAITATARIRES